MAIAPISSTTQPRCNRSTVGASGSDHFPSSILIQPSSLSAVLLQLLLSVASLLLCHHRCLLGGWPGEEAATTGI